MRRLLLLLLPAAGARGEGEVRLLTDDAIPRYLARGQELARAEQWDKVVDVLHRVVIGDPEVFPDVREEVLRSAVYTADGRVFEPARELCLKELARLPAEGLRAYRDAHDATARQLFAAAEATEEIEQRLLAYALVHDNYLPSSVGDDALESAGALSLALGRYYEALSLFRRLLDLYPKDTDRDLPLAYARAAYCAARIGDGEQLQTLLERLSSEHAGATVKVAGKPLPVEGLKDDPLFRLGGGETPGGDADWPMAGGNPARSRTAGDLPEDLPPRPFWSVKLSERDARLTAQRREWRVVAHDREPSARPVLTASPAHLGPYPTTFPVVHERMVLYKDGRDILARRIGSGTLRPLILKPYTADSSRETAVVTPMRLVRPGAHEAEKEGQVLEGVYEFLDYGAARLVVASDRIATMDWRAPPHELRGQGVPRQPPNEIAAYSCIGSLRWWWGPEGYPKPVEQDAWERDYQLHRTAAFPGPGVATGGILYTLATEREGGDVGIVSLWAFDLADGRVRFRTPLHYEDEMTRQLPRGAAVAVAGGVVYAVPGSGAVAAVDALPPGRIRWIARYERSFEGMKARGGRSGSICQEFAFNDPVVAAGKVFVAAPDAAELIALDAETGRLAWSIAKPRLEAVSYIVGVRDGLLFLAGDKVIAIDAAKGEIAWKTTLTHWPYGRGFVGERYVHIPTHISNEPGSRIERLDVKTGAEAAPLAFEVEKLGNLLSLDGRLLAATGQELMCFTTYEAEVQRVDAALARPGAPAAELLLERGLLALTAEPKRRDQAREDFARAIAVADTKDNNDLTLRGYAVDNLLSLAQERNDLGTLDEAEKIVPRERKVSSADADQHPYDAQIALLRAEIRGRLGQGAEALAALERFLDGYGHMRVVREGRVVDASAAGAALRDRLRAESPAFAAAFDETVRGRIEAAIARKDRAALKAIPERSGDDPPAELAYFARAMLEEEAGAPEEAEAVLRDFIERHPQDRRSARANLLLARLFARQSKDVAARRALLDGVSLLDETSRAENGALAKEVHTLLARSPGPPAFPRVRLPLSARRLDFEGAVPVAVDGGMPDGLALLATTDEYLAVDGEGKVRWRAHNPSRTGFSAGPEGDPLTVAVAGAVAAARFAALRDGDLLLGDVTGLMRVHAATGEVRWRYQGNEATARDEAQAALDLLREQLRLARTTGFALRTHPLPAYLLVEGVVVRVHPALGVEAVHAANGEMVWLDPDARGQAAVGPPSALGGLVVVGFTEPGWLRVYRAADGERIGTRRPEQWTLLAPPVLDTLGRMVVLGAREADGTNGRLEVFDVRGTEPHRSYPLVAANARVLSLDGSLLVYHDGGSGTENLHFVDLEKGTHDARAAPDLLRSVDVLADGPRLFVLTHSPGLEGEGARLFRVDLAGREVLAYDYAVRLDACARPVLLEHHVAVAALVGRSAQVRLFDREASPQSRGARAVFLDASGRETAELDFRAQGPGHPAVGLAAAADGLVVGHSWGVFRLTPPAKDGG